MKYTVIIKNVKTIDELEGSWTNSDFVELLKLFEYEDAEKLNPNELKEYLFMAISDFEPTESAAIILDYKLSEVLNEGQIDNLSHEMLREKVSENYSDIYIHKTLFNVNQLLYKAYNGKFQYTKANLVEFVMKPSEDVSLEISKGMVLRALSESLSENNLLNRLFGEQINSELFFPEAEGIVWEFKPKGNHEYVMVTSEKWLHKEDFGNLEYTCEVNPDVDENDE